MLVRRLDKNGDYQLGHGSADFFSDSPAGVGQTVRTRLDLWRGEWFLDLRSGTPWIQEILGEKDNVEAVLRDRILGTEGVLSVDEFSLVFDPDHRRATVTAQITTVYGAETFSARV